MSTSSSPQLFYIGVKATLFNPQLKKVLLLIRVREDGSKYWDMPGGRINGDELKNQTIDLALRRELTQEIPNIGDDYKVGKILNAFPFPRLLKDGNPLLLLFYEVTTTLREVELSDEHIAYKWVDLNDLEDLDPEIEFADGYKEALELLFTN